MRDLIFSLKKKREKKKKAQAENKLSNIFLKPSHARKKLPPPCSGRPIPGSSRPKIALISNRFLGFVHRFHHFGSCVSSSEYILIFYPHLNELIKEALKSVCTF